MFFASISFVFPLVNAQMSGPDVEKDPNYIMSDQGPQYMPEPFMGPPYISGFRVKFYFEWQLSKL